MIAEGRVEKKKMARRSQSVLIVFLIYYELFEMS